MKWFSFYLFFKLKKNALFKQSLIWEPNTLRQIKTEKPLCENEIPVLLAELFHFFFVLFPLITLSKENTL